MGKAIASISGSDKFCSYNNPKASQKAFLKQKKEEVRSKRYMNRDRLVRVPGSNDLSSKLNEAINRFKHYYSKVVIASIRYGIFSSLSQKKISYDESKKTYNTFKEHIDSFAEEGYLKEYNRYIDSFISQNSTKHNTRNGVYNPTAIIDELKRLRLQPLKSEYDQLSKLVTSSTDYFDDTFKKTVQNGIDILYNILYSYALLDVTSSMVLMPIFANAPKNNDLQNFLLRIETLSKLYKSNYKFSLMKTSLNVESDGNVDRNLNEMRDAFTSLKKLGILHKCDE